MNQSRVVNQNKISTPQIKFYPINKILNLKYFNVYVINEICFEAAEDFLSLSISLCVFWAETRDKSHLN